MSSPSSAARHHTLGDFDFALPLELIAQHPASERSASRLLDGRALPPADRVFRDLPALLQAGDLLVFNDTQVIKARLFGEKPTGGRLELLVERVLADGAAHTHTPADTTMSSLAHAKPTAGFAPSHPEPPHQVVAHMKVSKKPAVGTVLQMNGGFTATLLGRWPDADGPLFRLAFSDAPHALMTRHGHVPLPPYIERQQAPTHDNAKDAHTKRKDDARLEAEDERRYQTVFARRPGAAAAPTAALHFDDAVLQALDARGVRRASVTLHVGAGTFSPVKTENLSEHRMHSEWYDVPSDTVQAIADCRARGGRVVAVGTTTVRTLESWATSGATSGDTSIFITPGFRFRVVNVLLTNFHLPKSTLLMLVAAFTGFEHMHALYRHAIAQRYRFFSYGDAMLLERRNAD